MRLLKILALLAAAYFAYDFFVVRGGDNPLGLPEPRPVPTGEELRREPGRGLNPFVVDPGHGSAPQRQPMPSVPGR